MKRNTGKIKKQEDLNIKIIKYSAIGVTILAIIVLGFLIYSKNLNEEVKEGTLTSEQLTNILNDAISDNVESASSEIGKKVEEVKEEIEGEKEQEKQKVEKTVSDNNVKNETLTTNQITPVAKTNTNKKEEEKVLEELNFSFPVEGEIIKEFATDSLVYSETLQEWTTHSGIDIKADKTTIVKSAEAGTVKKIKNDPRYGLTIIIEHSNGYQTVYSNLLSSEFVVEGEKVEKGQALGTVGNTAAFESVDEAHLHFEIIKDSVYINPNGYLK